MPDDFKKILRLGVDMKLDLSSSALTKNADGYNWHIKPEGGAIAKRPGLIPTANVPLVNEAGYAAYAGTATGALPRVGVLGGAVYSAPVSRITNPWKTSTVGGV